MMGAPTKEAIAVPGAPKPFSGAPYSPLIRYGDLLFTAGQVAEDPITGEMVGKTIQTQTERVMENLAKLLEGAGSGLEKILQARIFLADLADWPGMNEVYGRSFSTAPPARSAIQVGLPAGVLVEIEAVAHA